MAKTKKVLMLMHNGVEDSEYATILSVLTRRGVDVVTFFMNEEDILTTQYRVKLQKPVANHVAIHNLDEYTGLVIPGGVHITHLENDIRTKEIVDHFIKAGNEKIIGAMSNAPMILAKLDVIKDVKVISYPDKLIRQAIKTAGGIITNDSAEWGTHDEVSIDKNIITSLESKSALPFTLRFLGELNKKG